LIVFDIASVFSSIRCRRSLNQCQVSACFRKFKAWINRNAEHFQTTAVCRPGYYIQ
jgi:hypothetical protein